MNPKPSCFGTKAGGKIAHVQPVVRRVRLLSTGFSRQSSSSATTTRRSPPCCSQLCTPQAPSQAPSHCKPHLPRPLLTPLPGARLTGVRSRSTSGHRLQWPLSLAPRSALCASSNTRSRTSSSYLRATRGSTALAARNPPSRVVAAKRRWLRTLPRPCRSAPFTLQH